MEKYNPINGAVKSVKYNGQGYSNNVPTVSIDITGENGEIALLTFSRYDKELLGIVYNASYKPSLEYTEIPQEKSQEKAKEFENSELRGAGNNNR